MSRKRKALRRRRRSRRLSLCLKFFGFFLCLLYPTLLNNFLACPATRRSFRPTSSPPFSDRRMFLAFLVINVLRLRVSNRLGADLFHFMLANGSVSTIAEVTNVRSTALTSFSKEEALARIGKREGLLSLEPCAGLGGAGFTQRRARILAATLHA